jgi:hypothetical protein
MVFWKGMRRAWAVAFVVTWFVVTALVNNSGTGDAASMRYGLLAAAAVAAVVWYLTRTFMRSGSAPRPEDAADE